MWRQAANPSPNIDPLAEDRKWKVFRQTVKGAVFLDAFRAEV
jgi:hypothetical protein